MLHVKGIDWKAVRLDANDKDQVAWTGDTSAPVAVYRGEAPRSRWIDVLLLAERLAPTPALLPSDPEVRALAIGLCHELLGERGLASARRLQMVQAGLREEGGFPKPAAEYLASKYGDPDQVKTDATPRVCALLEMLSARLKRQAESGSEYYLGTELSAVDLYSAAVMAMLAPLPEDVCPIPPHIRAAFESLDPVTKASFDPILTEHRDRIYRDHLTLPLSL